MQRLPIALDGLSAYKQFILYKKVASTKRVGKTDKFPCTITGRIVDAHDQQHWLNANDALVTAALFGEPYGAGFVFTKDDPFYFIDIDDCAVGDGTWSDDANTLMNSLPGAAIEVSQSGRGLHIIGSYDGDIPHGCKSKTVAADLYTDGRFVALTGTSTTGDVNENTTPYLQAVALQHFPESEAKTGVEWSNKPIDEWNGETDDDALIQKALQSGGASAAFGDSCGFSQLWNNDRVAFAEHYPDDHGNGIDDSRVDAALAQHLAFWTGNDCERVRALMWKSELKRDKWKRDDYIIRTVTGAVAKQTTVYTAGGMVDNTIAIEYGAPTLKGSDAQIKWGTNVRAQKLLDCQGDLETIVALTIDNGVSEKASFWIDSAGRTVDEIKISVTPIEQSIDSTEVDEIHRREGYQFLGMPQQEKHFKNCVYIVSMHRILTPNGSILKAEQFNAVYGGYIFQLDNGGSNKTTKKAFEAFTESQSNTYPHADLTCFRPDLQPRRIIRRDGKRLVNTYVPIDTKRIKGDATPFLDHVKKLIPDENDRAIIMAYMAACVQHKGVKFQWTPLLQGCEGNGKTLLTRCVAFAIGETYTHMPPALELGEKYNSWLFDNIFIGIEDIYVPEHKREIIEVIKPMITNDRLAKRAMQCDQVMHNVCANFILNSNHMDAVLKTRNDRRFCIFYTAQQNADDLTRDGMGGDYFPKLYKWLRADGYAIVNEYLNVYVIQDELNPATDCHRAPDTTSTTQAITESLGTVEQEILEAVAEGRTGFAKGWISSMAVSDLLHGMHRRMSHTKRHKMLTSIGYDYHPGLYDGRVNNELLAGMGKPRLYIKNDHISAQLTKPSEIARIYCEAQNIVVQPTNHKAKQL